MAAPHAVPPSGSGVRCDDSAGVQPASAELEPSQRPAQPAESSGIEAQARPPQRSGAGVDAAESDESDSDFHRSFTQGSTESDADVDDDGGIAELVEENNELHLRARYLEERLRAAEEAERRKMEARRAEDAAEAEARRQRSRLLWQKAILAVRAQISRRKTRELSQRLLQANSKAKEAASMSDRLEKEISKVKEFSNIFQEDRGRVAQTEQDAARLRAHFAAQRMRLEQAYRQEILEMQFLQASRGSSTASESSAPRPLRVGASTWAEAQPGIAARGSNPEPCELRDVTATIEEQQGAIDQLMSYTKALEAKLKERRSTQDELLALRQRLRLLEAQDAASSAPQAR